MLIAFHTPQICIRGTSVALYDYAVGNEEILNGKSIVVIPKDSKNDSLAYEKFAKRFPIHTYSSIEELDNFLVENKVEFLYCIKYGKNDGVYSRKIRTGIHCVFDMTEPHGTVYAGVSRALARKFNSELYVPHCVRLKPSESKENLRSALNIPQDALVFGRYGGMDTFNLDWVWNVIDTVLAVKSNVHFLFINTPKKVVHPRVVYLPNIVSDEDKNRFICTCDAYLEAGSMGHTFGLAIAEFSVNNKPAILFNGNVWNTAHLEITEGKSLLYKNSTELYTILTMFDKKEYEKRDNNCYKEYTLEKVMDVFRRVFLLST